MGLFGGKDDTKDKIEELKAKMQGGGAAPQGPPQAPPQQQPWQQQPETFEPPKQEWQPTPPPQLNQAPAQPAQVHQAPQPSHKEHHTTMSHDHDVEELGIILDLGEGMSLNLPIKSRMRLDEFLKVADRVRELKKIDHTQQQGTFH